jgi:hypothetical protein
MKRSFKRRTCRAATTHSTALAQGIIVLAQADERDPSVSVRVPCRQSVL